MEKLRRARINDSLNELKCLVLDLLNKDVSIRLTFSAFKKIIVFGLLNTTNIASRCMLSALA